MKTLRGACLLLLAVLTMGQIGLTACGSDEEPQQQAPSARPTTATTAPSAAPTPEPSTPAKQLLDAAGIAKVIKARIPQVKSVTLWNEETDPNRLMGRPNGYTSAAFIWDKRTKCSADPDTMCGAQVEQFANADDATRRRDYIAGILKDSPIFGTEYHTVVGSTLLRVSGELTPTVNRAYVAAFRAAMRG